MMGKVEIRVSTTTKDEFSKWTLVHVPVQNHYEKNKINFNFLDIST
ncbi:hypothetical protein BAT02nite_00320 [Bacillus atrophaeus]|nr:hypothetical protein BAT02nite_00320 [Bacillus atrophaeus]